MQSFKYSLSVIVLALMAMFVTPSVSAQTAHKTVLTWAAVSPAPASGTNAAQVISGYNVYTSSATNGEKEGTPLAFVPFGTNTYTDTAVTAGQTKFYKVSTVCSNCTTQESSLSTEVSGTTPLDNPTGPPSAPTLNTPTVQ